MRAGESTNGWTAELFCGENLIMLYFWQRSLYFQIIKQFRMAEEGSPLCGSNEGRSFRVCLEQNCMIYNFFKYVDLIRFFFR